MLKIAKLMALLFMLVLIPGTALAASQHQAEGRPSTFDPGDTRGIFIWHDDQGQHLRTTTRSQTHVFSGVIRTDGRFYGLEERNLENGDFIRIDRDHNQIMFRFTTTGGTDGLDFRIRGGDKLDYDLFMDGRQISPNQIYIGRHNLHPRHPRFTIDR